MKVSGTANAEAMMTRSIPARILAALRNHSLQLSLLAFALIPYVRMGLQGLILWDDLGFPPFAANLAVKKTFVWHSSWDDTSDLHDIPYWALVATMQSFGLSDVTQ